MQQQEERIQVVELYEIKTCIICGNKECTKCKSMIKTERYKTISFISVSGITILTLSLATSLTSISYTGIGISCGSILSLLFY